MKRFDRLVHGGMYRSRKGIILGVCRGIAEYFDFSIFWTRTTAFILLIFTGLWPLMAIYFIAALLLKPEPVIPIENIDQQEFYDSYLNSRRGATERIRKKYENLERRIQRMEHRVTEKDFDWEQRLNS